MEWNERYALGIEEIDRQHRELFRAVNRVADIVAEGDLTRNQRICMDALLYLKNYTFTHFQTEEDYQRAIHYPHFDSHKQIHDEFRAAVLAYEEQLKSRPLTAEVVLELVRVMTDWLINHITHQDQLICGALES